MNTLICLLYLAGQDEKIEWRKQELSVKEIQQKVKEYNAQINSNLFMNMVSVNTNNLETIPHYQITLSKSHNIKRRN